MISVIIPAHNAEMFLSECLESVLCQTDVEVIAVDDGSTDATAEILNHYASCHDNIRVIHAPWRGVSAARNVGIRAASGEWIAFVDADDVLMPGALSCLRDTALREDADVVVALFSQKPGGCRAVSELPKARVWSYSQAIRRGLYQSVTLNSPCAMIIRSKLVKDMDTPPFREGIRYEDLDAFYRLYEGAERIAYVPHVVYYYRKHTGSFINSWSRQRLDVLDVTDRMVEYMQRHHPELLAAALDRRWSAHYNMLLELRRHDRNNPALARCLKVVKEGRIRTLFNPYTRFKNKLGAIAAFCVPAKYYARGRSR